MNLPSLCLCHVMHCRLREGYVIQPHVGNTVIIPVSCAFPLRLFPACHRPLNSSKCASGISSCQALRLSGSQASLLLHRHLQTSSPPLTLTLTLTLPLPSLLPLFKPSLLDIKALPLILIVSSPSSSTSRLKQPIVTYYSHLTCWVITSLIRVLLPSAL